MNEDLTRGRFNRMLKYFRRKRVSIRYEHNDSNGGHRVWQKELTYDRFEIRTAGLYHQATLYLGADPVWSQELDDSWYFTGLGKLEMRNSGPRCYFEIKKIHQPRRG